MIKLFDIVVVRIWKLMSFYESFSFFGVSVMLNCSKITMYVATKLEICKEKNNYNTKYEMFCKII